MRHVSYIYITLDLSQSIYNLPYLHEHYSLTLTLCSMSTWMSSKERSPAKEVQFLLLICHYEPQVQRAVQFPAQSQSLLWWNQSFTNQHINHTLRRATSWPASKSFCSNHIKKKLPSTTSSFRFEVIPTVTCSTVQTTVNWHDKAAGGNDLKCKLSTPFYAMK